MQYQCSGLPKTQLLSLDDAIARFKSQLHPGRIGHILAVGGEPLPALTLDYQVDFEGTVHVVSALTDDLPEADRQAWQTVIDCYRD
ncbi:hypothetical protein [Lacticaseibacillus sp. GG6-2]